MNINKINVLIADDNRAFNELLCEYLDCQNEIIVVGTAFNGLDAVDLIIKEEPEVVVLDIIMPKLDGVGVINKINSAKINRKPQFIMLSAMGDENITQQALDLGAKYFIQKPFDMDTLVNKIRELLYDKQLEVSA